MTTPCKICGNEIINYQENVVCSKNCLSQYISQLKLNDNNPAWNNKKEKRNCIVCGKEFEYIRKKSNIEQEKIFCSLNCARNKFNNKETNLSHFHKNRFNKFLKNKIKKRDNYSCVMCNSKNKLEVHHIDYNKKNNEENNLITLCKKCHNITNFDKEFWTQTFIGLNSNSKIVKKGWGFEIHFINNEKYCLKYLVFFKGMKFSWHKHIIKQELWFCAWGKFECIINNNNFFKYRIFEKGDKIEIMPNIEHQLMALTNSIIIEVSTTDFDDDSIRIEKGD